MNPQILPYPQRPRLSLLLASTAERQQHAEAVAAFERPLLSAVADFVDVLFQWKRGKDGVLQGYAETMLEGFSGESWRAMRHRMGFHPNDPHAGTMDPEVVEELRDAAHGVLREALVSGYWAHRLLSQLISPPHPDPYQSPRVAAAEATIRRHVLDILRRHGLLDERAPSGMNGLGVSRWRP